MSHPRNTMFAKSTGKRPRSAPFSGALLHPLWILSLALLALNDHVLKGSGLVPGWLTGKLSDLAGLIVAPVLLAVLLRARTRRAVALVHAAVGLGFAALELSSSLTALANSIYQLAGFSWRSTRDLTDLLALAVLPIAYLVTVSAASAARDGAARAFAHAGKGAVRLLGTAGLLACVASSGQLIEQPPDCGGPDCDADGFEWPEDCNDYDPALTPLEGCPSPSGEGKCDDRSDNDGDGLTDCADSDCELACIDLLNVCSATPADIYFDMIDSLEGSTLLGTSVTEGSCLGADLPEVIFRGWVSPGVLTLGVPEGHGIHVRTECHGSYSELGCAGATAGGSAGSGGSGSGGAGSGGTATGGSGTGGTDTGGTATGSTGTGGSGGTATGSTGTGGSGSTATGSTGTGGSGGTATGGSGGAGGAAGSGAGGASGSGGASGDLLHITISQSQSLTVIVEAIDPFKVGPFKVPVSFESFPCGDGVRVDPEQCDDGNVFSADGCSATCLAEADLLCAGMPAVLPGQSKAFFSSSSRSFAGQCAGSLDTLEQGFHYFAGGPSVTVKVDSTANVALYATLGCGELAKPLGCVDAAPALGQETLTLSTQLGDMVTFFVELAPGEPENTGFTLEISEP